MPSQVEAVRPLRRVREGVARTRDERFELVKGPDCWQVRSLTRDAATSLIQGGGPSGMQAEPGFGGLVGVDHRRDGMTLSLNLCGWMPGTMNTTA